MGHIVVPHLFFSLGLSHSQPKQGVWRSKSGIRLRAIGTHGPPFGRARAILLYLTQKSAESGRVVRGSLDDVRATFGPAWQMSNLAGHLHRVIDCSYARAHSSRPCCRSRCEVARPLDVIRQAHYCRQTHTFELELGDELFPTKETSFRCPVEHTAWIQTLIRNDRFQTLDLALWYHWKLARNDRAAVDAFGPKGPFGLMPIAKNGSRQRCQLHTLHDHVVALWPSCPYRIAGTGGERKVVFAPWLPHDHRKRATKRRTACSKRRKASSRQQCSASSPGPLMHSRKNEIEQGITALKQELGRLTRRQEPTFKRVRTAPKTARIRRATR